MPTYTKDNIEKLPLDWKFYRKKILTRIVKISGPFTVITRKGTFHLENKNNDGVIAIDSAGWPYPIAGAEFKEIYEEVE